MALPDKYAGRLDAAIERQMTAANPPGYQHKRIESLPWSGGDARGIASAVAAFVLAILTGFDLGIGSALRSAEYYPTLVVYGVPLLLLVSLFPFIRKGKHPSKTN